MQSVCSHPTPSCYPIQRSNALFARYCTRYLLPTGLSRTVQQVSDPDPHVVKQAVREARGNGESERSMD